MSRDSPTEVKKSTVLVAGATGTAGSAYVNELVEAGYDVQGTVRPDSDTPVLTTSGAIPVKIDLKNEEPTHNAISDVDAVFIALLGRGEDAAENELEITQNVIDAAHAASVEHVVYTSVHRADEETGVPHFEVKGEIEEYLKNSGLTYTILRPTTYMDALSAPWLRSNIEENRVLASPILADTSITYLDTEDLATIGRLALEVGDLQNSTLPIGGPRAVRYHDLLPIFEELSGHDVTYQNVPLEQAEDRMGADIAAMVRFFNEDGFVVENDPMVEQLGIQLNTVEEYLTATWTD